ncbi:MAG: HTH-type transcriptional repressor NsrR [Myxococcota bacterium]|nr:HTH-type transcriptional repressor NsrR [Myxococcota bacterium]
MRLTLQTDYSLRILMYVGIHADRVAPAQEIAAAFGISGHHVAKVAKQLVREGYLKARRGKQGGLELALDPERIRVGDVIRRIEPHLDILECFDPATNTCPLTGVCTLEKVMLQARKAFLDVADGATLADLIARPQHMSAMLNTPVRPHTQPPARGGKPRRSRAPET